MVAMLSTDFSQYPSILSFSAVLRAAAEYLTIFFNRCRVWPVALVGTKSFGWALKIEMQLIVDYIDCAVLIHTRLRRWRVMAIKAT
jgi:hypothetical protein